jgi:hypothetical protein
MLVSRPPAQFKESFCAAFFKKRPLSSLSVIPLVVIRLVVSLGFLAAALAQSEHSLLP